MSFKKVNTVSPFIQNFKKLASKKFERIERFELLRAT